MVVEVAGCGEGKDPLEPLGAGAILMAVGAAAMEKLKVLPPPPAEESKPGVLGGGADGWGCGC